MTSGLKKILYLMYSFLEQLVFMVALVVGLFVWISFDSVFFAAFTFIVICIIFWAIPSLVKRLKK